jgi:histidinol-phosphate/aromatic aminotransferase/cobyric acid decarboxylase-like protein
LQIEPRERLLRLFEGRIYTGAFKDLSGWDRPALERTLPEFSLSFSAEELTRYVFDRELPNDCLEDVKRRVANLVSLREGATVPPENLLLAPGATAALAVVLHFLRADEIGVVITDPPFYFSIKKLCDALGIKFISPYKTLNNLDDHDELFQLVERYRHKRKAVILTHPRYVVSRNYPVHFLSHVRSLLDPDDVLVIDQSVDMEFCNRANYFSLDAIKIRTVGKALGFNGSRLAAIVASSGIIARLNKLAGTIYGSLDVAMLKLGALVAGVPKSFENHLNAARRLVEESVLETRLILGDSIFEVVTPENGFLGYIVVDTSKVGRVELYQALLRESVNAMFSAHLGLGQLGHKEMIRVNYLLDVRDSLMVLKRFADERKGRNKRGRYER